MFTGCWKLRFIYIFTRNIYGYVHGYVHGFCNRKVRENKTKISILAHHFFGFDLFYFFKGYESTNWETKDVSIGGSYLTHINYVNVNGGELKCINTLKYYQKILGQFVDTLSEKDKEAVNKLSEQFLKQHDYFSDVWKYLGPSQKEKFLDIVAGGKSLIPHER